MADTTKIYPVQTIKSSDNITFKNPRSHLFNIIHLSQLYSDAVIATVEKEFRIDLLVYEYTMDFGIIKVTSIMNSKPQGIFSYHVGDQVYIPMPNAVQYENTKHKEVEPNSTIILDYPISESLHKSYDNFQQNLNQLDISQVHKYIDQTSKKYILLESLEKSVNLTYPGIVDVE